MITPYDDRFHLRTGDPLWNESGWFPFAVPERALAGFIYCTFRPNMGLANGGVVIWDRSGADISTCLHWNQDPTQPIPPDAEMFDFSMPTGLTVKTIELQRSFEFTYQRYDCRLDLRWDAIMESNEMARVSGDVNPAFSGFWSDVHSERPATGHFDQAGRFRGTVTIDGETLQVDCFSMRDRTWGPRRIHPIRFAYDWGVASDSAGFLTQATGPLPVDEDPVVGTVDDITAGWYLKDGVVSPIVSGTREVLTRAEDDGCAQRQVMNATDQLGRVLQVEGIRTNQLRWTGYNDFIVHYGLAEWTFDGVHAHGEMQEGFNFQMNRRLHKTLTAAANVLR
jgi:hypothetical protein